MAVFGYCRNTLTHTRVALLAVRSPGAGLLQKALRSDGGGACPSSGSQLSHGPVQGVHSPVVVIPAKEPAHEGGGLEALLHDGDGGPPVAVSRVRLDIPLSCRHTCKERKAQESLVPPSPRRGGSGQELPPMAFVPSASDGQSLS